MEQPLLPLFLLTAAAAAGDTQRRAAQADIAMLAFLPVFFGRNYSSLFSTRRRVFENERFCEERKTTFLRSSPFRRRARKQNFSMPVSPRSPLAERVSFPSADADVTLEGRLALWQGQKQQQQANSSEAGASARSSDGDASTSTPPPPPPPPPLPADLALVLLHPHAALGGSLADPICSAIYREAKGHPRFGAVARYNARGAGGSSALFGGRGGLSLLLSSLWRSRQGCDDAAAVIRAVSTGEGIEIDGEPSFGDDDEEEEEDGGEGGEEDRRGGGASCSSSAAATPTAAAAAATTTTPFSLRRRRRRRRRKGYPRISRTFVVGYSWGSCVGAAAASDLASAKEEQEEEEEEEKGGGGGETAAAAAPVKIGGFVAVSPPLGPAASLALGSGRFFSSLARAPSLPALVAVGDCDLFCSERAARSSVESVNRARSRSRKERREKKKEKEEEKGGRDGDDDDDDAAADLQAVSLEVSPGLDHFWGAEDDPWSREEIGRLARRVVAWVLEQDERQRRAAAAAAARG